MDILSLLNKKIGQGRVEREKNLFPYFTLRTHSVAQYYIEVLTREEFLHTVQAARETKTPLMIIGGGSNIAVTSRHIDGIVMKNSYVKLNVMKESKETVEILISSGYTMSLLVNKTIDMGWEGFEYHRGLPGTLGGAVYMNSKWTRPPSQIGDSLLRGVLLDEKGFPKNVGRDYFEFKKGYSILQKTKEILLEGVFLMKKTDPTVLRERAETVMNYRQKTQPSGAATCGCFFRNISEEDRKRLGIDTTSSGYLIEQSGMKNISFGAFAVSDIHANFIVNTGAVKPETRDLLQLIDTIKKKVKNKFGVELVEEVVVV